MEQRRNQIVELVNRKGSISFAQLKEAFPSVSEMTLRTDLKALDEARRVVRVHGGVKSVEQVVGTDDLLSRRSARNAEAKQIIAEKATALLRPNTTLFLDSGSTATAVARCIPDQPMLIYTSGLSCAMELAKLDCGIALLASYLVEDAVKKGELCTLNVPELDFTVWLQVLRHEQKAVTPQMSAFYKLLREYYKK